MNYEDCLRITINDSVADVLKRLPELSPEDRFHLMMEWCELITTDLDMDDVLMVPKFEEEELK